MNLQSFFNCQHFKIILEQDKYKIIIYNDLLSIYVDWKCIDTFIKAENCHNHH